GPAIGRSREREGITGKEIGHAGEDVKAVPVSEGVGIELLAAERAAKADRVRSLDPGHIVSYGVFILYVPEGVDEGSAERGKAVRHGDVNVFAGRCEYLQRGVFRRLAFSSHRPGKRGIELVDNVGREDVTLTQGQKLIMGDVESRPKAKPRIVRAR